MRIAGIPTVNHRPNGRQDAILVLLRDSFEIPFDFFEKSGAPPPLERFQFFKDGFALRVLSIRRQLLIDLTLQFIRRPFRV